ncbi:hypothetical protein H0X48_03150 [Candidatus Dependentiae bacterium]|nr:hypothetical protein [Candidatus Dependentiae bacterium]
MKKTVLFLMSLLFLHFTATLKSQIAPYSITFFIRPLPATLQTTAQARIEKMVAKPGKLAKKRLTREFNPKSLYSGIYVTHLGQLARSSVHGQVTLPRKSADTTLYMLVTEDIKPLLVNPSHKTTLSSFLIDPKVRSSYYLYQLTQSPETGLLTWYVSEQQVPKDKIPADAFIVFADPQSILIPLGPTVTANNDNLVLPDIYVINTADTALNALRFLKLRNFFHPVTFKYNYLPQGYQERVL